MAEARVKFTYEDYKSLPSEGRYELLEGELVVVPSPRTYHQRISGNLEFLLRAFVQEHGLGEIFHAPYDVVLSEETVLQPDIIFIAKEQAHIITEDNVRGAPDLVIEVLSEATAERDRIAKRLLYAKYGVKEYWLVDPARKSLEVLRLSERGFETVGIWWEGQTMRSPLIPGLAIDLGKVF
jgi:Uma2 family endonuclease